MTGRWLAAAALLCSLAACATAPAPEKPKKRFYAPEDRFREIAEATLFEPRDPAALPIVAGPPDDEKRFALPFNAWVFCAFEPDPDKSGRTPKFDCIIEEVVDPKTGRVQKADPSWKKDKAKVKYGPDNGEVYSEVAATRLLWLLGFYADAMYPVRVVCRGCPEDPSAEKGPLATRAYWYAAIERKTPGKRMYEHREGKHQGWRWDELEAHSGAPVAQKEALKLLAAFLVHGDNKPPQQRLVCDDVEVDDSHQPWRTTCKRSRLYVQDLGGSFGGGGLRTSNRTAKMNLEHWQKTTVWKRVGKPTRADGSSAVECRANLPSALSSRLAGGGLHDPVIGEEGRRLLAERLALLSDEQIAAIFRTARVDEAPTDRLPPNATDPDEVIQAWVGTFREKRMEIQEGACRWKEEPDSEG